jgi:hypothetical protein
VTKHPRVRIEFWIACSIRSTHEDAKSLWGQYHCSTMVAIQSPRADFTTSCIRHKMDHKRFRHHQRSRVFIKYILCRYCACRLSGLQPSTPYQVNGTGTTHSSCKSLVYDHSCSLSILQVICSVHVSLCVQVIHHCERKRSPQHKVILIRLIENGSIYLLLRFLTKQLLA